MGASLLAVAKYIYYKIVSITLCTLNFPVSVVRYLNIYAS